MGRIPEITIRIRYHLKTRSKGRDQSRELTVQERISNFVYPLEWGRFLWSEIGTGDHHAPFSPESSTDSSEIEPLILPNSQTSPQPQILRPRREKTPEIPVKKHSENVLNAQMFILTNTRASGQWSGRVEKRGDQLKSEPAPWPLRNIQLVICIFFLDTCCVDRFSGKCRRSRTVSMDLWWSLHHQIVFPFIRVGKNPFAVLFINEFA